MLWHQVVLSSSKPTDRILGRQKLLPLQCVSRWKNGMHGVFFQCFMVVEEPSGSLVRHPVVRAVGSQDPETGEEHSWTSQPQDGADPGVGRDERD